MKPDQKPGPPGRSSWRRPRRVTLVVLGVDIALVALMVACFGHPAVVIGTFVAVYLGAALFTRRLPVL